MPVAENGMMLVKALPMACNFEMVLATNSPSIFDYVDLTCVFTVTKKTRSHVISLRNDRVSSDCSCSAKTMSQFT